MQVGGAPTEQVSPDSAARVDRRQKRREYDTMAASRTSMGCKPNQLDVKPGGYIDQASPAKSAWDDAIRSLVPRMLDMSVIDWEGQRPEALEKLRDALDRDFEYLGCPLSMRGFRDAVKRFMKTERSRLKGKFLAGDTDCPIHIQPSQWEKLQAYWNNTSQVEKAEKMAVARRQVRNASHLGRRGRGGRDADVVSHVRTYHFNCNIRPPFFCGWAFLCITPCVLSEFLCIPLILWQRRGKDRSPGLTEIAEAIHGSEGDAPQNSVWFSTFPLP
jgi:hypothetical protein